MKEKYIFFTLLIIVLILLLGSGTGKTARLELSAKEKALQAKSNQAMQKKPALAQQIDMEKVQDLVAFSDYERLLARSPFFQVAPRRPGETGREIVVSPVEERTPLFKYKGKISAGKRLVVIIEQTRSGEVFMVSKAENVGGYKVLDITDSEVILSKEGEKDIILNTIEKP